MTAPSPVTQAAHSLIASRPGVISRDANSLAFTMLDAPWPMRRQILSTLEAKELRYVVNEVARETGSFYGLYYDTPSGFTEDVIGDTIWSQQKNVLDATVTHKRVAVPAGFGVGKCVYEHDVIPLADGRMVPAGELVGREFKVMAWREDGQQLPRAARAQWNATEPIYRVRTVSGREVRRNAHHPLWAAKAVSTIKGGHAKGTVTLTPEVYGWTAVSALGAGDLILVPERHHAQGTERVKPELPALLGYLIGDGGTTKGVTFTQQDGPALDEFRSLVEALDCELVRGSRPYDYRVRHSALGNLTLAPNANSVTGMAHQNPIHDLVREWGLWGKKANDKRLPAWAWTLPNDQLAEVLGRLFACDAWVYAGKTGPSRNAASVGICLASEGLIRDVEAAMLRLGVWGNVRKRTVTSGGKRFPAWEWSCRDRDALRQLARVLDMPGKNEKLNAVIAGLDTRSTARMRQWPHRNAPVGYRWDRIAEVEVEADGRTVAIEVDEDHTFVTSVVEHNTWLAGRLVAWAGSVNPAGSMVIVTTATRERQVKMQLWPHIRKAVAKGGLPGGTDIMQWKAPDAFGNEVVVAYGFSAPANDEAAMQGIHGTPKLLLVVDEAGGIAKLIGKGTNNLLTGDARMLAIGNPAMNDPGSWFEELCDEGHDSQVPSTVTIPISTLDSPAVTGEATPLCRDCTYNHDGHTISLHLPDRDWLRRTMREYGVIISGDESIPEIIEVAKDSHPYIVAKVLARFPKGSSNRIVPAGWIDAALEAPDPLDHSACPHLPSRVDQSCTATRPAEGYVRLCDLGLEGETREFAVKRGSWVRLGVDVAADGGDEVTIYRAIGDVIHHQHASSGAVNANQVVVAERVLEFIHRAERLRDALGTPQRVRVKVDKNGLGQGVVSMLERWGPDGTGRHNAEIVGVMVSEKPEIDDESIAMRPWIKRDEMWLAMRQLLQPDPSTGLGRLRLRVDHQCRVQLSNPMQQFKSGGYTVVESKKAMKARGVDSPDRAEGAILAVYEPYPIARRKRRGLLN